ncbi:L-ribulose-5-phosphate 3-epimerase [Bifidobacterium sp.]|jgi:hexulose-6-phosphate isomerase|uniref:L-ribulose-5-phosphate 3-epimerase n=1 Tax=Bifidobacterium sp. TaxID=41200 RepID=UPI0025BB5396|nr:L-ribulose-5-phosphate 3-epimerase [Bifidobacterium sp.]MCI1634986.1 L-ribulose-5-phosphate 3-epimerase [Bifidobacterium sp.]
MNSLGIYEKALPKVESWQECFATVRDLGFNFLEFSVDESDERLARLEWTRSQRELFRDAAWHSGVRVHTLMLSGHRRFPLGSADPVTREKSLTMLYQAIDLAYDLDIRNIQMAGYDVYYEPKTVESREWFIENLKKGVEYAASRQVMLDIETMDDPFLNSVRKIKALKTQIHSPWLQVYPDLGNLTAWPDNNVGAELESGIDNIVSIHLKDTKPVTATEPGEFRDVPFGDGTVDFEGCLRTLHRLGYTGAFTIEMWTQQAPDPISAVRKAKAYFAEIFKNVGIEQETLR